MKLFFHFLIVILLTILTQIGGIAYLLSILFFRSASKNRHLKRIGIFVAIYLLITFIFIPVIAPFFGREKIKETKLITANTFFTKLTNRNYVRPELNDALEKISIRLDKKHQGIKLIYLEANFPFINKFPLIPHLSHSDGKKIDLSFIYMNGEGVLTNKKPSVSGYGVYEGPHKREFNQTAQCKKSGFWQYDLTKYLTLGKINKEIRFSEVATRSLLLEIVKQPAIGKIFIEPHLKTRMGLSSYKIRFHGCRAVRHDDHIHVQLR